MRREPSFGSFGDHLAGPAGRYDTSNRIHDVDELFEQLVDLNGSLKAHRDYIQQNGYGFGERAFWWAWKLICDEIPNEAKMLEIGVYKSATLSLWRLLKPIASIYGISPLNTAGDYPDFDYGADIEALHNYFNQQQPVICEAKSLDLKALYFGNEHYPFDVIYIDGDHSYNGALHDLIMYSPMVKQGGFLIMDDACSDMHMPWGFFQGHQEVTNATLDFMKEHGDDWEFITNVVHLLIYRRK